MRFQRISQLFTFSLFIFLFFSATYPLLEGLPVDFFLRLDPLISTGTIITLRKLMWPLIPGIIVIGSTLLIGRAFCGHICPMGTTLDLFERGLLGKRRKKRISAAETSRYRRIKYVFLVLILGAALAGVSLVFLGSPISLATRFYSLALHPLLLLTGDTGLNLVTPLLPKLGLSDVSYWDASVRVFSTNLFIALFFAALIGLAMIYPRFWCRNLCPAGALLAFGSRKPLLSRKVSAKCNECGLCQKNCPMSAIEDGPHETNARECIVCLKCKEVCPQKAIGFSSGLKDETPTAATDFTRRGLVFGLGGGLIMAGLLKTNIGQPRLFTKERPFVDPDLIRPPGALPEPEFLQSCVRCGQCMKVCPSNTLQPTWAKAGLEGVFSPILVPRLAACAVNCNACGQVCPTGAIRALPLIEKNHAKIGTAWINRRNCLVWEQDKKCLVCDEVCPYNAISFNPVAGLQNAAPFVHENRCTGCGWCETACPINGASAIRVNVVGEVSLSEGSYIEKAEEYGFQFKIRDPADRLAPDTFENSESGLDKNDVEPKKIPDSKDDSGLPPGFTNN